MESCGSIVRTRRAVKLLRGICGEFPVISPVGRFFIATSLSIPSLGKDEMIFCKVVTTMVLGVTRLTGVACALFVAATSAQSAEVRHTTDYSIALGILPIAKASFTTRMNADRYHINGTFSSAGLASVLKDISGRTSISGVKTSSRLQAQQFSLLYSDGKRSRTYNVKMRGGNVTSSTISPAPKKRPGDWVEVKDRDLRAVLDPISGLIFPENAKVCPSRLPVYDGESRMDLILTSAGSKPFETKGFKGEAIVCKIKYSPRSGYRHGRKDIEYLKSISMEVWFAKSEDVKVYAPVYARIPTRIGQVHINATRFGK
jgi:hypothetical protein